MDVRYLLEKGFFQVGTISFIESSVKFLSIALLARMISPENFGFMGVTLLVITTFSLVAKLGIPSAIVQRKHLTQDHIKTSVLLSVVLGMIISFITYLASDYISVFFAMPELSFSIKLCSIVIVLESMFFPFQAVMQKEMRYKTLSIISLFSYIFGYLIISLSLAYLEYELLALLGGYVGQSILLMFLIFIFSETKLDGRFTKNSSLDLLRFGFGFTLAKFGNQSASEGGNFVIGKKLGPEELGEFGKAFQLFVMPANLIAGIVDKVTFPLMSSIQGDRDSLRSVYLYALQLMTFVSLPLTAFLFLFSEQMIFVFLGEQWGDSVVPFSILVLGLYFRMSYRVSDSLSRALGRVYRRALIQWVYALIVVVGSVVGSGFGLEGVAVAVLGGTVINFLMLLHMTNNLIGIKFKDYLSTFGYGMRLSGIVYICCWVSIKCELSPIFTILLGIILSVIFILVVVLISKSWLFGFYLENKSK